MESLLESFFPWDDTAGTTTSADNGDESEIAAAMIVGADNDDHSYAQQQKRREKQRRKKERKQVESLRKLKLLSEKAKQDASLTGREINTTDEAKTGDNQTTSDTSPEFDFETVLVKKVTSKGKSKKSGTTGSNSTSGTKGVTMSSNSIKNATENDNDTRGVTSTQKDMLNKGSVLSTDQTQVQGHGTEKNGGNETEKKEEQEPIGAPFDLQVALSRDELDTPTEEVNTTTVVDMTEKEEEQEPVEVSFDLLDLLVARSHDEMDKRAKEAKNEKGDSKSIAEKDANINGEADDALAKTDSQVAEEVAVEGDLDRPDEAVQPDEPSIKERNEVVVEASDKPSETTPPASGGGAVAPSPTRDNAPTATGGGGGILRNGNKPPTGPPPPIECDYDNNPTKLFLLIQDKRWYEAAKRCITDQVDATTWISRKNKNGRLRWRMLCLHAAVIFEAPADFIDGLLRSYPSGAAEKDDQGMLPIHLAIRNGSPVAVVQVLLEGCPDSINTKDGKGRLPLILAEASKSPNRDAVVDLLQRHIEDLDPTKLFLLIQEKRWSEAAKRCDTHQIDAATWISKKEEDGRLKWRLLPIHAAVIFEAPTHVLEAVLRCHPRGAAEKDDQGMLPIHLAIRNESPVTVVQVLLEAYPDSIKAKDRDGRVPLILAEASKSPNRDAVVELLQRHLAEYAKFLSVFSRLKKKIAVQPKNQDPDSDANSTKLFLLIQEKRWSEAAQRCITHQADAATWISRKDKNGQLIWRLLPIHAAVIFEAPTHVIEGLLRSYPRGATKKEDQGNLPIHLAARNGSPVAVVQVLLEAYPGSIKAKDRKGRVPLILAEASKSPNRDEVIEGLTGSVAYIASADVGERKAVSEERVRSIRSVGLSDTDNNVDRNTEVGIDTKHGQEEEQNDNADNDVENKTDVETDINHGQEEEKKDNASLSSAGDERQYHDAIARVESEAAGEVEVEFPGVSADEPLPGAPSKIDESFDTTMSLLDATLVTEVNTTAQTDHTEESIEYTPENVKVTGTPAANRSRGDGMTLHPSQSLSDMPLTKGKPLSTSVILQSYWKERDYITDRVISGLINKCEDDFANRFTYEPVTEDPVADGTGGRGDRGNDDASAVKDIDLGGFDDAAEGAFKGVTNICPCMTTHCACDYDADFMPAAACRDKITKGAQVSLSEDVALQRGETGVTFGSLAAVSVFGADTSQDTSFNIENEISVDFVDIDRARSSIPIGMRSHAAVDTSIEVDLTYEPGVVPDTAYDMDNSNHSLRQRTMSTTGTSIRQRTMSNTGAVSKRLWRKFSLKRGGTGFTGSSSTSGSMTSGSHIFGAI